MISAVSLQDRHAVQPEESAFTTPSELRNTYAPAPEGVRTILKGRAEVRAILQGTSNKKFVVVGPCSIHDPVSALEYAHKLKALSLEVQDKLVLVMRTYFEKPRTTVGWKGYINDPHLNGSFEINDGLSLSRKLLTEIAEIGVPVATEALDPYVQTYLSDLITWTAIGARTVESQIHRELASGLPSPVGFKNSTDGRIDTAIDAIKASSRPHHCFGINNKGRASLVRTEGNSMCHVVLRGGKNPNYDRESVRACSDLLVKAGLPVNLMIDCSHGNSGKDPAKQSLVLESCLSQIAEGNNAIKGMMIESHLHSGNQPIEVGNSALKYGVFITDACLSWEETESMLREAVKSLR